MFDRQNSSHPSPTKARVVLSDHAFQRCREAGINPADVKRAVSHMPPFTGTLKWKIHGKFIAVVSWKNGVRLVITVVSHTKQTNYHRQVAGWFASAPRVV